MINEKVPTVRLKTTRRIPKVKLWKSKQVHTAQSQQDQATKIPGSNPPKCLEMYTASEQVEGTYDDPQLEGLMVPLLQRGRAHPRSWKFSSRSLFKGQKRAKASSGSDAGSLSFVESMNGCVHQEKVSDKLLVWSLEKVFRVPDPKGKNRAMVSSRQKRRTASGGAGEWRP